MGATAFAGTLMFAWVGHRLPRVRTLVAAFTFGGPSRYFFLATTPGATASIVGFGVTGVGLGPINPILGTLEYERVPERLRARASSERPRPA